MFWNIVILLAISFPAGLVLQHFAFYHLVKIPPGETIRLIKFFVTTAKLFLDIILVREGMRFPTSSTLS